MKPTRRSLLGLLGGAPLLHHAKAVDEASRPTVDEPFDPTIVGWLNVIWRSWEPETEIAHAGIKITVGVHNRIRAARALLARADDSVIVVTPTILTEVHSPAYKMLIECEHRSAAQAAEEAKLIKAAYALPADVRGKSAGLDGWQFFLTVFRHGGMAAHRQIEFATSTGGLPEPVTAFARDALRLLKLE